MSDLEQIDVEVAIINSLGDTALKTLADRLRPHLAAAVAEPARVEHSGWMNAREAAIYLGTTTNALHKLTAARSIPFEQDVPGGRLWFSRRDLDRWRRGHGHPGEQGRHR